MGNAMTLEATFRQLSVSLHKLHDALNALHVTVGDKPPQDETALADAIEDASLDMMAALHEVRKFALHAQKAVAYPTNLEAVRHALTQCQEQFHRIEQQYASDLVSYEKLKELDRLASERRAWLPWANSIRKGIDECRPFLVEANTALSTCWQELAERLGALSISVKATNVGQQITVAKPGVEDLEIEGVT